MIKSIYRILLSLAGILFFFGMITAQEVVADSTAIASDTLQPDSSRSLLWKITGNGLEHPSYVFGTIHLIPSEDYFTPPGMEEAILASESVVFEIDIAEMTDLSSQMSVMMKAFMADGTSLKDLLSEEDYQLVKSHFEAQGIPFFLFERMKPMFLSSFIAEDFSPDGLQSGTMKSYEMEIYSLAEENAIETAGLETVEFQLSIFDSIPYRDQAVMLVESIRGLEGEDDSYQILIDLYKQQDIEGLYAILANESPELEEHGDLLIGNRNQQWIGVIKDIMNRGPAFFAVGAGHLGGEEGVINLLRKAGYTVEAHGVKGQRPVKRI